MAEGAEEGDAVAAGRAVQQQQRQPHQPHRQQQQEHRQQQEDQQAGPPAPWPLAALRVDVLSPAQTTSAAVVGNSGINPPPPATGAAAKVAGPTSAFRGVCWNKKNRRWQAAINAYARYIYLGGWGG